VAQPLVGYSGPPDSSQASFGPTPADVMKLQQLGFQGWLTQHLQWRRCRLFKTIPEPGRDERAVALTNSVMKSGSTAAGIGFLYATFRPRSTADLDTKHGALSNKDALSDAFREFFGNFE